MTIEIRGQYDHMKITGVDELSAPVRGVMEDLGVIGVWKVFSFTPDPKADTAWVLSHAGRGTVAIQGARVVYGVSSHGEATDLVAISGGVAVVRQIGYKGRSSRIKVWEEFNPSPKDGADLLLAGTIVADKEGQGEIKISWEDEK